MKNFEYFAPGSLPEALTLLDNIQQTAKVLAGGTESDRANARRACPNLRSLSISRIFRS